MEKKLIYIADDEVNICNIIKSFLIKEGFEVMTFFDGQSLLDEFNKNECDLVVIDIMMPKLDGYSLCTILREKSSVPIIIVSAKDTEPDRIAGLNLGSDDYLTKPFSPIELVARIKSIFRRIELDKKMKTKENNCIEIFNIKLNPLKKQAFVNDKIINLTTMEFTLLHYLIENKERAISRDELLDKIWGFDNNVETRATDDMIKRIRKKIKSAGSELTIETVWGFGFRIKE